MSEQMIDSGLVYATGLEVLGDVNSGPVTAPDSDINIAFDFNSDPGFYFNYSLIFKSDFENKKSTVGIEWSPVIFKMIWQQYFIRLVYGLTRVCRGAGNASERAKVSVADPSALAPASALSR
ncbi:hypothetical protein EVAR_101015_1 [Eumeta japonica]|uniref:Uncharacterized protein n=1 Tax=Eumeta variegata TaxID=151549 RepID=A0A4C1ZSI5_EUMVA|nr:hypothetical protein EVAR_101015_1 [Eumeta japonica]